MELSNLIYLDTSFVIEVYEESNDDQIPIKITKSENISGGLSAGFVKGGASTTETKEFPFTTRRMYGKVRDTLLNFQSVALKESIKDELPDYFWTTGILGSAGSETRRGNELLHRESYFRLYPETGTGEKNLVLVTNDVYFSAGYDQVQKHLGGSCQGFGVEVRGLFKLLAIDRADSPICAPMVMEKLKNV